MTRVIDLDARRAQRAEAESEDFSVRIGGEDFTFPNVREWPVEITERLSNGDLTGAIRLLLPEADHSRFFATRPTMGDLSDLFDSLGQSAGVGGLGNSEDSATS